MNPYYSRPSKKKPKKTNKTSPFYKYVLPKDQSASADPSQASSTSSAVRNLNIFEKTRHVCSFRSAKASNITRPAPYASFITQFLYKWHKMIVISRHHPYRQLYFRSEYTLWVERERQMSNPEYRHVIHPFSKFNMLRQLCMLIVYNISFTIAPLQDTFNTRFFPMKIRHMWVIWLRFVYNIFFLIDMFVCFFVGYTIDNTQEIVLDKRKIAVRYLRTHFFIDLICWAYAVYATITIVNLRIKMYPLIMMLPYGFLRCVRIRTMFNYCHNTLSWFKVKDNEIQLVKIFLFLCHITHWCTCILYFCPIFNYYLTKYVGDSYVITITIGNDQQSDFSVYFEILLAVICHFLSAGKSSFRKPNPLERLILAFCTILGYFLHIFMLATILQLYGVLHVSQIKFEEMMLELKEYMHSRSFTESTKERLLTYYNYKFQQHFFNEQFIASTLSEHLRCEVTLYACRNLIDKVEILKDAPKDAVGWFISMLKNELFLPGDVILDPRRVNDEVYFISYGTVALCVHDVEVIHMGDGSNFGEIQVLFGQGERRPTRKVLAAELSEIFYMSHQQFMKFLKCYPNIEFKVYKFARYKETICKILYNETMKAANNDIVTLLRRGEVLDRRLLRDVE